jgi:hypothetical protein
MGPEKDPDIRFMLRLSIFWVIILGSYLLHGLVTGHFL